MIFHSYVSLPEGKHVLMGKSWKIMEGRWLPCLSLRAQGQSSAKGISCESAFISKESNNLITQYWWLQYGSIMFNYSTREPTLDLEWKFLTASWPTLDTKKNTICSWLVPVSTSGWGFQPTWKYAHRWRASSPLDPVFLHMENHYFSIAMMSS